MFKATVTEPVHFKATLAELEEARISFTIIGHYLLFRMMKVNIGFDRLSQRIQTFDF